MLDISRRGYAHPEALVSTDWVDEHLQDPAVRLIEANEDDSVFAAGHLPCAVEVNWLRDLHQPGRREYVDRVGFERLMSRLGITPETTVVLYGDSGNWWAAYVFWVFQLFHHRPAKLMDGGRLKWLKEGRALTQELTLYPLAEYSAVERDDSTIRARREEVIEHAKRGLRLVDVRSREEYAGVRLHIPDYPDEGALRGGHIPGASNVLWSRAIHPGDGSFRSANELKSVYVVEQGFRPDEPIIAYCRIGERSSHTWFVLTYLLGFQNVRNYDGGWVEWGNLVNVPIERLRR